jgi:hypothetical protein
MQRRQGEAKIDGTQSPIEGVENDRFTGTRA